MLDIQDSSDRHQGATRSGYEKRSGCNSAGARCAMRSRDQFAQTRNRTIDAATKPMVPIRSLIAAILQRALDDAKLNGVLRRQALAWLHEESVAQRPGSFEWCCAALGLSSSAIRSRYRTELYSAGLCPSSTLARMSRSTLAPGARD